MTQRLLDNINNPGDLKKLSVDKLPALAQEIREIIINNVASSGGHLASSLGAVELIIGIHYCLNAPEDIIIWDVGHQAYAHKILTGRKDKFATLRKTGGISGFPNKYESEYDVFTTGHGSTSISTALGMAAARDLEQKKIVTYPFDEKAPQGINVFDFDWMKKYLTFHSSRAYRAVRRNHKWHIHIHQSSCTCSLDHICILLRSRGRFLVRDVHASTSCCGQKFQKVKWRES